MSSASWLLLNIVWITKCLYIDLIFVTTLSTCALYKNTNFSYQNNECFISCMYWYLLVKFWSNYWTLQAPIYQGCTCPMVLTWHSGWDAGIPTGRALSAVNIPFTNRTPMPCGKYQLYITIQLHTSAPTAKAKKGYNTGKKYLYSKYIGQQILISK